MMCTSRFDNRLLVLLGAINPVTAVVLVFAEKLKRLNTDISLITKNQDNISSSKGSATLKYDLVCFFLHCAFWWLDIRLTSF